MISVKQNVDTSVSIKKGLVIMSSTVSIFGNIKPQILEWFQLTVIHLLSFWSSVIFAESGKLRQTSLRPSDNTVLLRKGGPNYPSHQK